MAADAAKQTGTTNATCAIASCGRPTAKPALLAARPDSAAPSAKPICCTVGTDDGGHRLLALARAAHDPLRDERPADADPRRRCRGSPAHSSSAPGRRAGPAATSDTAIVSGPSTMNRRAPVPSAPAASSDGRRPAERGAGHAVAGGQRIEAVQALQEDRDEDLQRAVGDRDQQQQPQAELRSASRARRRRSAAAAPAARRSSRSIAARNATASAIRSALASGERRDGGRRGAGDRRADEREPHAGETRLGLRRGARRRAASGRRRAPARRR